jgi:hypothetical protein
VEYIARNFTILSLDVRRDILALNLHFKVFSNSFDIIAPTFLIWAYVFKQKYSNIWFLLSITLLASILAIINPISESLALIVNAFDINYSILNIIKFLCVISLVFPFWAIIVQAVMTKKLINFKKITLSFIMLSYAVIFLLGVIFGEFSLLSHSFSTSICLFFALVTLKSNSESIERILISGKLKYFLLVYSVYGIILFDLNVYKMQCFVLLLFCAFLMQYAKKHPSYSQFKEVHYE